MSKLQQLKEKALQNEAVRREYDALEHEFALLDNLLRMRQAAGLTQEQVADRMGTKKSNISRLEKGASNARLDTLERYADACGFTLNISFSNTQDGLHGHVVEQCG